jgi:hypothetical protein
MFHVGFRKDPLSIVVSRSELRTQRAGVRHGGALGAVLRRDRPCEVTCAPSAKGERDRPAASPATSCSISTSVNLCGPAAFSLCEMTCYGLAQAPALLVHSVAMSAALGPDARTTLLECRK